MRNYEGKYGTEEELHDTLDDLFLKSDPPELDSDDSLQMPMLHVDLDQVNSETSKQAKRITERLSAYYFDQKYIDNHPYIPTKIAQTVDNIRRLLKMLSINEAAQDTLIQSIVTVSGKGTMYQSLTSLQNSMLSIQSQLNSLVNSLENIFKEMQDNCEETFEQKNKEELDDGSISVRGSKDFIKAIEKMMVDQKSVEQIDTKNNVELEEGEHEITSEEMFG